MENNFVGYRAASLLDDKGLDIECLAFYNSNGDLMQKKSKTLKNGIKKIDCHESNILAPLYQQAIKWFAEVHGIHIMLTDHDLMDIQIEYACRKIKRPEVLKH